MRYFIFCIVFSTVSIFPMSSGEYYSRINCYEKEILKQFSFYLDLKPVGLGGGVKDRKQNFCLHLKYPNSLTLNNARSLIVKLVEIYIDQMNSHTELAKFEKMDFPFTSENIHLILQIGLEKTLNCEITEPIDMVIFINDNLINYEKFLKDGKFISLHKETYDEAKAELIKQGINISQMVEETLKRPPKGGWLKALFF